MNIYRHVWLLHLGRGLVLLASSGKGPEMLLTFVHKAASPPITKNDEAGNVNIGETEKTSCNTTT